jgi:hypothetical protein
MPGAIPGPVGFATFAAVKFGGYILAGVVLKKCEPLIAASSAKIAATRTGLGILLGPAMVAAAAFLANPFMRNQQSNPIDQLFYPFLFTMRFFVWLLVIFLFTRQIDLSKSRLALYALAGAFWSCLMDVPGVALAFVSPGKISIC